MAQVFPLLIFACFRPFSTQFRSKTAKIDSKSAPLQRIALGALRSGGVFLWLEVRSQAQAANLRGQTPIRGFLRAPAVLCGFLRKSPAFPDALFSRRTRRESARISLQSCGPATQWKTGRTTKKGKKWENRGKFAPIENGKKMAKKYRKFSIAANFPRLSHFCFPIFVVRPIFHCVAGPHDCKNKRTSISAHLNLARFVPLGLSPVSAP